MISSYNVMPPSFPTHSIHPNIEFTPLIAQAHKVVREFFNSCCSVTCLDIYTVVGDEDSLCSLADDNALLALNGSVN